MADTAVNPDGSIRNRLDVLPRVASLTGWPSPTTGNANGGQRPPEGTTAEGRTPDGRKVTVALPGVAQMAGWTAPRSNDGNGGPDPYIADRANSGGMDLLTMASVCGPARLTARGDLLTGSTAGMESGGQLNPEHPRWLQGYPAEWGSCGATAMQSSRKPRRSSSPRSSTPPIPTNTADTALG